MKNDENWTNTLAVFSHPNHELAILCFLKRIQATLVFLTDGGGKERVNQTIRSLEGIGLRDKAVFLGYSEKSFYNALLDRDIGFYREVVSSTRAACDGFRPYQVLCDAIEFYNPIHDMALPIVRAALKDLSANLIYEVPIIHQKTGVSEAYELQRMYPSRRNDEIHFELTPEEREFKLLSWKNTYLSLRGQLSDMVKQIPHSEVVAASKLNFPEPGNDCVLRYEWRAQVLLDRGEIERKISFEQHYLPIARFLVADGMNELHN